MWYDCQWDICSQDQITKILTIGGHDTAFNNEQNLNQT